MAQLNACQFRHGLEFGHQDIFDLLNRFFRYHHFKSVSDGHSAPIEKNRLKFVDNQRTNRATLNFQLP